MSIIIKLAETDEDRINVYRIRYEVFTIEMGNDAWSDHNAKTFIDPWDQSVNYCFVVIIDSIYAATTRIFLRKEKLLQFDEYLPFDEIAKNLGLQTDELLLNIAYSERTAILAKFRGSDIFKTLFEYVHHYLNNVLSVKYVLGLIRKDNVRAIKAYQSKGYECEKYFLNVKGYEMTVCFKVL